MKQNLDHTVTTGQSLGKVMLKKLNEKYFIQQKDIVESMFQPYQKR